MPKAKAEENNYNKLEVELMNKKDILEKAYELGAEYEARAT